MSQSVRLVGYRRLERNLERLGDRLRADVQIDALKESAEPMREDYRAGAHTALRSSVKTRVLSKRARKSEVALGSRHPLAHLFEFGTEQRVTERGAARGRIQAMGFARRAFDTNVDRWFRLIGKILWREVKRARR